MPDAVPSGGPTGTIVLLASGLDPAEDAAALELLVRARAEKAKRRLLASAAIEAPAGVKVVRVDKWYSDALAELRNHATLSGEGVGGPIHRDGHDLFCLREFASGTTADAFVLVRGAGPLDGAVQEFLAERASTPFRILHGRGARGVIFDGRSPFLNPLLAAAVDLFLSAAPYAIARYDLSSALSIAAEVAWRTDLPADDP